MWCLIQRLYSCVKIFTFNSVFFFKQWMLLVLWSFYSICIMVMYLFAWHSWNFKENRITQDKVIDFSNLLVLNLLPSWSKELHVYLIAEAEQQDTAWDVWALISLPRCQVIPCDPLCPADGSERACSPNCINRNWLSVRGYAKHCLLFIDISLPAAHFKKGHSFCSFCFFYWWFKLHLVFWIEIQCH